LNRHRILSLVAAVLLAATLHNANAANAEAAPGAVRRATFEAVDLALDARGTCSNEDCWRGWLECTGPADADLSACDAIMESCKMSCRAFQAAKANDETTWAPPCFVTLRVGKDVTFVAVDHVREYRTFGNQTRVWFAGINRPRVFDLPLERWQALMTDGCPTSPSQVVDTVVAGLLGDPDAAAFVAQRLQTPPDNSVQAQGFLTDLVVRGSRRAAQRWGDAETLTRLARSALDDAEAAGLTSGMSEADREEMAELIGRTVALALRRIGWHQ
jgi:hypothetical protein